VNGLHALVLAAGAGARFGGGKLLAPWRGGKLIDGAIAAALAAPVETVTVATGADPAVAAYLDGNPRLQVIAAPDHAEGLAASLRAGIRSLPGNARGVLVFLGDMPLVPVPVLEPLAAALAHAPAAAPVFEGRRGHPVALSAALFPDLLALSGDRGARALLAALGAQVAEVPAPDAGVLVDVDERKDLEALQGS
jgi:molybdenum cofactor cytidylyltransferase